MASWLTSLLKPLGGTEVPAVALGAFGKHPGWNDHIEDIGLETEALLAARQLLYVQGIGGLIDSAAWEKLGSEEVLDEFGHVLVWFGEGELLAARLWSSSDGKGRTKYPMVVAAHATQVDPARSLHAFLPELERLESACRGVAMAGEVVALMEQSRLRLRQDLLGEAAGPPPLPPRFRMTADEAWLRTFYALESQLTPFGGGRVQDGYRRLTLKLAELPIAGQQLRLPAAPPDQLAATVLFWQRVVAEGLQVKAPLLFLQPIAQPWLDLIVGCPTPKQLLCLRASGKTIPPLETIPYTLPDGFRGRAEEALAAAQR